MHSSQRIGTSFRERSLEDLEGVWDKLKFESGLAERCHSFRKKPLNSLSLEELRTLIGQGIGLAYLIPISLEALERDALSEGDFYPGDLLSAVLRQPLEPENLRRIKAICRTAISRLEASEDHNPELVQHCKSFVETHP